MASLERKLLGRQLVVWLGLVHVAQNLPQLGLDPCCHLDQSGTVSDGVSLS